MVGAERELRPIIPFWLNVLNYWFAELLWLMNEKQGCAALSAYTGKDIQKAAYRKACQRLGLKGYKDRMRRPAFWR